MFNVLFVDDDSFMLRALFRLAKRLRPDWQFFLEENCLNWAQSVSDGKRLDLVVCDYLMPSCNGDKVLADVANVHPGAIRVLLTGDTTEDVVCNAGSVAHFVLSKPFNEQDILKLFMTVEQVNQLPVSAHTRAMLCSSALLLPLPAVVREVHKLLANENTQATDIAELIQHEPVITARLLQLANSAFMGFTRQTLSLEEAIKRLGVKLTAAVITALSIGRESSSILAPELHQQINNDAFDIAINIRTLSKALACKTPMQEQLFIAALLSAIGGLISATAVWQQRYAANYVDWPVEKLHAVVSAFMLTIWGYSEDVIQTVLQSASPDFSVIADNYPLFLYLAREQKIQGGKISNSTLQRLPNEKLKDVLLQL